MSSSYEIGPENKVRQLREKARYDTKTVHDILDAGLVAHTAFVQEDGPVVVPMIYGREGETIYLHGARKARVIKLLEKTDRCCINVTQIDGLVLARSTFNSSMQYRSVTVFGKPQLVEGNAAKLHAMKVISDHLMPGRWDELRDSHENEIKMTGVIAVTIESAAAKISAGMPDDETEDYDIPVWAGIIPITTQLQDLVDDTKLASGLQPSEVVRKLQRKII